MLGAASLAARARIQGTIAKLLDGGTLSLRGTRTPAKGSAAAQTLPLAATSVRRSVVASMCAARGGGGRREERVTLDVANLGTAADRAAPAEEAPWRRRRRRLGPDVKREKEKGRMAVRVLGELSRAYIPPEIHSQPSDHSGRLRSWLGRGRGVLGLFGGPAVGFGLKAQVRHKWADPLSAGPTGRRLLSLMGCIHSRDC